MLSFLKKKQQHYCTNERYSIGDLIYYQCGYLSIWSLLSFFFSYYIFPQNFVLYSYALHLCLTSSCGGIYISYIDPKTLILPHFGFTVSGADLRCIDFIAHHIPTLLLYMNPKYNNNDYAQSIFFKKLSEYLWIITFYFYSMFCDWKTRYSIVMSDEILHIIFYILLFKCLFIY
jgi:hypothetical protein